MAVVHPSKGLKCDGFGSFSFFPSGFLFLRRKKKIGDSQVQVTCGTSDWSVDDYWYFSAMIG